MHARARHKLEATPNPEAATHASLAGGPANKFTHIAAPWYALATPPSMFGLAGNTGGGGGGRGGEVAVVRVSGMIMMPGGGLPGMETVDMGACFAAPRRAAKCAVLCAAFPLEWSCLRCAALCLVLHQPESLFCVSRPPPYV